MTVINNADAVYLGGTAVDRVYLGSERVWPAFRPVELFANSEQGAWYDPSDISTLFQDAAGTTPVTADGDPVGRMLDKSANGNHASQTVSGSRPVYRTDGVLHWLEFDGVDDTLLSDFITLTGTRCGASIAALWDSDVLNVKADGTGFADFTFRLTGNDFNIYQSAPQRTDQLSTITARTSGGVSVVTAIASESDAKTWQNGVEQGSRTTGAFLDFDSQNQPQQISLFSSVKGGFSSGSFYGAVVSLGYVESQKDQVEAYLANLAGVTL